MIKLFALISVLSLRLYYQPVIIMPTKHALENKFPASTLPAFLQPVRFLSFNGNVNNNKVFLEWQVDENETADQFEVEKSTDGKKFVLAALVFGTDLSETSKYVFYEKAPPKRYYYRIKLITKNRKTEYSPVIEIKTAT